jgi:hypothetical protein
MIRYSMSETGACPRVLSAMRLGNEPVSRGESDLERLKYYTSLEAVAAEKLIKEGFVVLEAGECQICKNGRMGHHIEIEEDLFKLVGHLDRRVILPDERRLPVEIKCLGPNSWKIFQDSQFKHSMGYAYQECCYLQHEKSPGIYWIMNRDNGEVLKYIVNDTNNEYNLKGFEKITLPVTYDQIIDKLNLIEIVVSENKLHDPDPGDSCFWCSYKYLCTGQNSKVAIFVNKKEIEEAANTYKSAKLQKDECEDKMKGATSIMIDYAKTEGNEKFRSSGVSFSYHGMKYKTTLDEAALGRELQRLNMTDSEGKKISYDDIMAKVQKRSKPFDSYTIKILESSEK